ncbi:MAG: hypothetical protein A3F09_05395 [Chlamydiae bacterium RIFCSPHIGHO2_12_FULL_49_11]|nr:MAG: hypothetical protein A3F09_05395 [Chlamydiae bacterium RIFCSPHIGHO2_12_FULL_49_11]
MGEEMKINTAVLDDIDTTLSQLLENRCALETIRDDPGLSIEAHALDKLQESLAAHLSFLDREIDLAKKVTGHSKNSPVRATIIRKYRELSLRPRRLKKRI